jgi:hypothetical protein
MKKLFLLTVSILMVTVVFGQSISKPTDPIPSYNVLVIGQLGFGENVLAINGNQSLNAEKRDMNVSNDNGGSNAPVGEGLPIGVLIYRLDHSIILGPFSVPSGETLSVPIDDGLWGVTIGTDTPTYVSVWTDGE